MMKKCAKCDKTVYPVEEFKCLDKTWHKTCFKCNECGMILNMKSYKGFDKQPYCNAHCPQAKATIVADTPEARRLAENTKIQSNIQYHADFEKQKGKLTQVADDPETLRLRSTSKIQSQAAYHGDYEKKKQMEEIRNRAEDPPAPVPVAVLPGPNFGSNMNKQMPAQTNNNAKAVNISAASVGHSLHHQSGAGQSHPHSHSQHSQHTQQYSQMPTSAQTQQQQQHYQPQNKNINDNVKNSPSKMGGQPLYYDQQPQQQRGGGQMGPQASSMSATARLYPNQVPPVPVQQQYQQQQQQYNAQLQQQQFRQQQQQQQHMQQQPIQSNIYPSHPAQPPNYYHSGAQQAALHQQQQQQQAAMKQMSPAHHMSQHHQHSHQPSMLPPQQQQQPAGPNQGRCFRAIYDYTAQDVDEVTFMDGDLIINCQAIDDGWMTGTVQRTGKTGMLPSNYVETA